MILNDEKDFKSIKKVFLIFLSVFGIVIMIIVTLFFNQTKQIWNYPGLSTSTKYRISYDNIYENIDSIYQIESYEKFIIITSSLFTNDEFHTIYDNLGRKITVIRFSYSIDNKVKIMPMGRTKPPSVWIVKGDDKNDDIIIWHTPDNRYEAILIQKFRDDLFGIK